MKGQLIIINAVIWGLVMMACAFALRGTDGYMKIQMYLLFGAIGTLFVMVFLFARDKKKQEEEAAGKEQSDG